MTLNLLLSLHMLLLVALLFGTLTSALIPARSPYTAIHAAAPIPTAKPIVNIKPRATAAPISSFTKSHKLRRQVQGFTCPPAVNGCKGAKDCLYPSPDRCNWFIQCDASGIAYTGACPMESMVCKLYLRNVTRVNNENADFWGASQR